MTIPEFKKIARLLKQVYAELEKEALAGGVDVFSPEYDELVANARLTVLANNGFTLEEYRAMREKVAGVSKEAMMDLMERTKEEIKSFKEIKIPTEDEIKAIARSIAEEFIKPPQITTQVIKETTVEKPQIIKETRVEKIIEEKAYNDKPIVRDIEAIKKDLEAVPRVDAEALRTEFKEELSEFMKNLQYNIDILGMPDFRKLAMGLQSQIHDLQNGSTSTGVGPWIEFSVDGTTTVFAVTKEPTEVNSDGTIFISAGSSSYSYDSGAGTVTLINPPQFFGGYR